LPRDSLFGERIIWEGRPEVTTPPAFLRALATVAFVIAAITLSFAAVIAVGLREFPGVPLLFAGWCVALGVLLVHVPRRWARTARYLVTEKQVIVKYGPFSRSIERGAISFARIFWNADAPHTGDLEVVRAVPTGALRRRLRLKLPGLLAPDRVFAIIRGAEDLAPAGQGERPVGQRLDRGERVVWTAQPRPTLNAYLPHGQREWVLLAISAFLLVATGRVIDRAVPVFERLAAGALPVLSFSFLTLLVGFALMVLLMLGIAGYLTYDAVLKPGLLSRRTRYLVTNKRVLIQRDTEELHLDRKRIIDVIAEPVGDGLRNLFLVLDGPRARAVAASGAFGEMGRSPHLLPVFESVADADSVSRILLDKGELPEAA
jgi:hypothetical protein